MTNTINSEIVAAVTVFGTPVVSGSMRYVIPLPGLKEQIEFINPKDAGTEYGAQKLKGDGQDILILNGLSRNQIIQLEDYMNNTDFRKNIEQESLGMASTRNLLNFLEANGYNDRYSSNLEYMASSLKAQNSNKKIGLYSRNKDEVCNAVVIPIGTTYQDGEKTQQATVEGALFIVSKSGMRITNVPADYNTLTPGGKISDLATIVQAHRNTQRTRG